MISRMIATLLALCVCVETTWAMGSKPSEGNGCEQPHELPIVTHWGTAGSEPGYEWGAASQFMKLAPTPLWGSYDAGACYYAVHRDVLTNSGDYPGATFSIKKISNSEARDFARSACQRNGVPVRFLRPDLQDRIEERLRTNPGFVQAIHGMVIGSSMATLILPPNWTPGGKYPIIASSLYDLNSYVFSDSGALAFDAVSKSASEGRKGLIAVLWNGGGVAGTRGIHPVARWQFDQIIQMVSKRFGGDASSLVLYGASRGGMAALAAAGNPDRHSYRTRFVYAAVPGVKIGSHAKISPLTLPGLMTNFDYTTALTDAWRPGWRYPRCGFNRDLWGKTGLEALLHISSGSADADYVDEQESPISDRFIAELKKAGTEVLLESSTHDFIIPFPHEAEYLRKLRKAGVPVESTILVRAGHQPPLPENWFWDRIWPPVSKILMEDPSQPGSRPSLIRNGEIHYYKVSREKNTLEPFNPSEGQIPFTIEVPRVAYVGMEQQLIVSGDPGTEYELLMRPADGSARSWKGVLPDAGNRVLEIGVATAADVGRTDYDSLRIKRPGGEWKDVDLTETTSVDRTRIFTEVRPNIPFEKGMDMTDIVSFERPVPGADDTSWGASEW